VSAPILPAPVTEEEIAALLESAFSTWHSPTLPETAEPEPADDSSSAVPRRRNLPRRSEAA